MASNKFIKEDSTKYKHRPILAAALSAVLLLSVGLVCFTGEHHIHSQDDQINLNQNPRFLMPDVLSNSLEYTNLEDAVDTQPTKSKDQAQLVSPANLEQPQSQTVDSNQPDLNKEDAAKAESDGASVVEEDMNQDDEDQNGADQLRTDAAAQHEGAKPQTPAQPGQVSSPTTAGEMDPYLKVGIFISVCAAGCVIIALFRTITEIDEDEYIRKEDEIDEEEDDDLAQSPSEIETEDTQAEKDEQEQDFLDECARIFLILTKKEGDNLLRVDRTFLDSIHIVRPQQEYRELMTKEIGITLYRPDFNADPDHGTQTIEIPQLYMKAVQQPYRKFQQALEDLICKTQSKDVLKPRYVENTKFNDPVEALCREQQGTEQSIIDFEGFVILMREAKNNQQMWDIIAFESKLQFAAEQETYGGLKAILRYVKPYILRIKSTLLRYSYQGSKKKQDGFNTWNLIFKILGHAAYTSAIVDLIADIVFLWQIMHLIRKNQDGDSSIDDGADKVYAIIFIISFFATFVTYQANLSVLLKILEQNSFFDYIPTNSCANCLCSYPIRISIITFLGIIFLLAQQLHGVFALMLNVFQLVLTLISPQCLTKKLKMKKFDEKFMSLSPFSALKLKPHQIKQIDDQTAVMVLFYEDLIQLTLKVSVLSMEFDPDESIHDSGGFSSSTILTTLLMTCFNIAMTLIISHVKAKELKVHLSEYFLHTLTGKSNFVPFVDALSNDRYKDFNGAINFQNVKHYFTDNNVDAFIYDLKDIDQKLNMKNWPLAETAKWLQEEALLPSNVYSLFLNNNIDGQTLTQITEEALLGHGLEKEDFDFEMQVRFIPSTLAGWDEAKEIDQLESNVQYGDKNDDEECWAINFDEYNFNRVRVETMDGKYIKHYYKDDIVGKMQFRDEVLRDDSRIEGSGGGVKVFIENKLKDHIQRQDDMRIGIYVGDSIKECSLKAILKLIDAIEKSHFFYLITPVSGINYKECLQQMKNSHQYIDQSYHQIFKSSQINEPALLAQEIRKMKSSMQRNNEWKAVRYIPSDLQGFTKDENMNLSQNVEYGKPSDLSKAWARKFDHMIVLRYKVESQDKEYVEEFDCEDELILSENFLKDAVEIGRRGGAYVFVQQNDDLYTAIETKEQELETERTVELIKTRVHLNTSVTDASPSVRPRITEVYSYKVTYNPDVMSMSHMKQSVAAQSQLMNLAESGIKDETGKYFIKNDFYKPMKENHSSKESITATYFFKTFLWFSEVVALYDIISDFKVFYALLNSPHILWCSLTFYTIFAAAVMCYQVVVTYQMNARRYARDTSIKLNGAGCCKRFQYIIEKWQQTGVYVWLNMFTILTPLIFIKCLLVDIIYTLVAIIMVPFTAIYNHYREAHYDIRDTLDVIYAYTMGMKGANVEGVRRLRVVSQFFFENLPQLFIQIRMYVYYKDDVQELEKYGITINFLLVSIFSSLLNAIFQMVILHMEATSGQKSLLSYMAMCFVGQTDYVPILHKINPQDPQTFIDENGDTVLDFNKGPVVNYTCFPKFKLQYKFYDNTLEPLKQKLSQINKYSSYQNRIVIDFGNSLDQLSGEKLLGLLEEFYSQANILLTNFRIKDHESMFGSIINLLERSDISDLILNCIKYESRPLLQITGEFIQYLQIAQDAQDAKDANESESSLLVREKSRSRKLPTEFDAVLEKLQAFMDLDDPIFEALKCVVPRRLNAQEQQNKSPQRYLLTYVLKNYSQLKLVKDNDEIEQKNANSVAEILYQEFILDPAINEDLKLLQPFFDFIKKNRLYQANTKHMFKHTHDDILKAVFKSTILNKTVNTDLRLLDSWLSSIELEQEEWIQVRHVPKSASITDYAQHDDKLMGTEEFGSQTDMKFPWGIQFHSYDYYRLKVESIAEEDDQPIYQKVYNQNQLVGALHNDTHLSSHLQINKNGGMKVFIDNPNNMKIAFSKSQLQIVFELYSIFGGQFSFEELHERMHSTQLLSKIKFQEFTEPIAYDIYENYVLNAAVNPALLLIQPCAQYLSNAQNGSWKEHKIKEFRKSRTEMSVEVWKMLVRPFEEKQKKQGLSPSDDATLLRWFHLLSEGWCPLEERGPETQAILFHVFRTCVIQNLNLLQSWNNMLGAAKIPHADLIGDNRQILQKLYAVNPDSIPAMYAQYMKRNNAEGDFFLEEEEKTELRELFNEDQLLLLQQQSLFTKFMTDVNVRKRFQLETKFQSNFLSYEPKHSSSWMLGLHTVHPGQVVQNIASKSFFLDVKTLKQLPNSAQAGLTFPRKQRLRLGDKFFKSQQLYFQFIGNSQLGYLMRCQSIASDYSVENALDNDCYDPGIIGKYVYFNSSETGDGEGDCLYISKGMEEKFRARFQLHEYPLTKQQLEQVPPGQPRENRYTMSLHGSEPELYMKKDNDNNIILAKGTKDALEIHFPAGNNKLFEHVGWTVVEETTDFLPGFDFVDYDEKRQEK